MTIGFLGEKRDEYRKCIYMRRVFFLVCGERKRRSTFELWMVLNKKR